MDLAQYFNTMNVLKLKQIIKEEVEKALKEAPSPEFYTKAESTLSDFYDSYLAKEFRLKKEITNEERIERLQAFIGILKSYIDKCEMGIDEENSWISSRGKNVNEGYKLESGEQKIIDDLFSQWKKDKNNTKEYKEEYKKLSISAQNKLNGMIRNEREESGKY